VSGAFPLSLFSVFGAAGNRGFALLLAGGAFVRYGSHQSLSLSLQLFHENPQNFDPCCFRFSDAYLRF
jgi:hypothetical protein